MRCRYLVSIMFLICISTSLVDGQSPYAAQDSYQRGSSRYKKGDLDGAITEFTRAIELSSQIADSNRKSDRKEGELNFVGVKALDPMAAQAYASRALMRYL